MTKGPKVLIYDIETTHNVVAQFSVTDEYTPHTNILQERYVICAAWQWLGDKKIHTVSVLDDPKRFNKNPHDDYHVVKTLHELFNEADILVAHNGDQFDNKWVLTRIIKHKLPAPPPVITVDTKKVAKNKFLFNANNLDYLGKFLGLGKKKSTPSGLWLDVLKGDRKAVRIMVDYNKGDVELLRKVFLTLRPYMSNHVNAALYGGSVGCPRCQSTKVQSRGTHKAISRVYQRYQCQTCGGWFKLDKPEKTEKPKYRVL